MKKYLWGIITGVLIASTIVALAEESFFKGKVVYLLKDNTSLLSQPNTSAQTITKLLKGTPMVVVENDKEWVKIAITGFLPKSVLSGDYNKLKGDPLQASMIVLGDKATADQVLAKIRAGGDFAKIAKEQSLDKVTAARGGDLGAFYPGDFAQAIENAITRLKPGQVSEIVSLNGRFHIFKRIK